MKIRFSFPLALALLSLAASPAIAAPHPSVDGAPSSAEAVEQAAPELDDPCLSPAIAATPSRPNWTAGAATTQCNVLEFDSGWLQAPMGHGVMQTLFPASIRYGLTPRMDLRWGMPGPIEQSGGGASTLRGVTDQCFSVTYRFWEQSRRSPAFAAGYGLKEPHANPAKGFGTGYVDHQLVFIASRDLGRTHVDFNLAGTIAGSSNGKEGALQAGLVAALPLTKSVTWLLESEGGSQPGTSDRYGAALSGFSWALRPWLVADAAYTRAYTAGAPRAQITAGLTYAVRSGILTLARGSRFARWLGR
jgi:hypothetical protein